MTSATKDSRLTTLYVGAVIIAGAAILLHSANQLLYVAPVGNQWFVLAGLTLLTGSFTISMSSLPARVSVSETFVFASVLFFGTAAGTVTVVLESLVMSFWLLPKSRAPHRVLFNASATAIAIWVSGTIFYSFPGVAPYFRSPTTLPLLFLPLATFTVVYFLLNTWLVAFAVALHKKCSPLEIWWPQFTWLSVNYFSGASVAALIVTYSNRLDVGTLWVIIPILVITYLTFRTAMGRVDDASRHLAQLNKLYLSTIETLAMAIDAKDQVTHGHIRRVQNYAVGLARFVGVTDQGQIQAIEAAALLHDMGKLAVPEYILNKPGKLTPAEFEKMKLHASVGADILSAIAFPYPVVPIVRHHHESWNGTGYPAGLAGTDIPIGARILAVVDCYDALTSDRPYRPHLSDEEAVAILLERRGSMYDPLIVDTFVQVHDQITTTPLPAEAQHDALNEISNSAQDPLALPGAPALDEIAASADEMLTLFELARGLAGQASLSDTGDVIAKHLRRLIPSSLCIFFLYDPQEDDLVAAHAFGEASSMVKGLRIALGQRLSGWVAANQQTIVNSDPSLDLGDVARTVTPRLRSCLSVPLLTGDQLVGVLTVYSSVVNGFSEDHRRIIEAVAKQIGHTFKRATDFDTLYRRDALTGLPNAAQLERLLNSSGSRDATDHFNTLLLLDVIDMERINVLYGRDAGDEALLHVVRHTRAILRIADLLFRHRSDDFVVLLNGGDAQTAATIASSIRDHVRSQPLTLKGGNRIMIDLTITSVAAPTDGASLDDLIATARGRVHATPSSPGRIH